MFRHSYLLALLVTAVCDVDAKFKNYGYVPESPEFEKMLSWFAPEKMLKNYYNNTMAGGNDKVQLNSSCNRDLLVLEEAIGRREKWALAILDASSKVPLPGLLRGNVIDLGQYDECLAARSKSSSHEIHGHQCTYSISVTREDITLPVNPTLSVCLPSTCSAKDVVAFFNATTSSHVDQLEDLKVKIVSAACSPTDRPVWDSSFIACTIILASLVTFLVVCTIIEVSHKPLDDGHSEHHLLDTLAMFSLRKSAASILSMEVKKGTLPAIDGIRCLSMVGIVLFHQYNLAIEGAIVNSLDFFEWSVTWNSLYVYVSLFAVDTFFTVSGFLMAYLFLKQMPKQKKFDVPMYYLHRYLRLTPAVVAMVVFTIVFIPKLGSGTLWDTQLNHYVNSCQTKWWPTLLYLQNFVEKENYCLHHLWYLAVDMQLFWISPLILYPLYKKPKFGLILLAALLISSTVISASIIGIEKLHVSSFHQDLDRSMRRKVFMDVYSIPYHRAGPWLIGIFLGYEVATHDRRLSIWSTAAGWLISMASFAFCIFGKRSFLYPDYEYNLVWETYFSVVSRPMWGLGVCWISYACIKNKAGFLSSILSFRIYLPLSRLSYGVYLVHFILLTVDNAALKTPQYFSEYNIWRSLFDTLVVSTTFAFLINLIFESPVIVLEKIFKRKSGMHSHKSHTHKSKSTGKKLLTPTSIIINNSATKSTDTDYHLKLMNGTWHPNYEYSNNVEDKLDGDVSNRLYSGKPES